MVTCGKPFCFIIDEADYALVAQYKWYKGTSGIWARVRWCGQIRNLLLHRLLCIAPIVDHINGNVLDNRRANLRPITKSGNARNGKKRRNNSTGLIGVHLDTITGKYRGCVTSNYKTLKSPRFTTATEAAKWHDDYVRKHYPETGVLSDGTRLGERTIA